MTKQVIQIGQSNTKQGDSLRVAFTKINDNFTELYNRPLPPKDVSELTDEESILFDGNYNSVVGRPSQDDVAITGQYTSLNDAPSGNYTYDISTFIKGRPLQSENIFTFVCPENILFPQNMRGSVASCGVMARNNTELSIRKNGVQFAVLIFTLESQVGMLFGTATTLSAGDTLSVIAPNPVDATLADISISLVALRQ